MTHYVRFITIGNTSLPTHRCTRIAPLIAIDANRSLLPHKFFRFPLLAPAPQNCPSPRTHSQQWTACNPLPHHLHVLCIDYICATYAPRPFLVFVAEFMYLFMVHFLLFLHQNCSLVTGSLRKLYFKFKLWSFLNDSKYCDEICCICGANPPLLKL